MIIKIMQIMPAHATTPEVKEFLFFCYGVMKS